MNATDVDALRHAAHLAGFELSAEELEPLRSAVERAREALARLERLPLASVEPVTQYRVV